MKAFLAKPAFAPSRIFGFSLLLGGMAMGCGKADAPPSQPAAAPPKTESADPVAVSWAQVTQVKAPRNLALSGSLAASEESEVAAGAPGKVLATFVERGSVVKRGQILARLDSRTVAAQAREADAQLEVLKAQKAQAILDCQRAEQMFQKGATSRAEHDRIRTGCETTKWSLSAAEARRGLIAESLRDAEIRAPFAGQVVERFISAGEYVRPDSRIVTLVSLDSLRVELTVPEADVPLIKVDMPVVLRSASLADKTVTGKIRYVGPSVRRQTRDAIVEAVVDNAQQALRPGMFVTAELSLGERLLPAIPEAAIRTEGKLHQVFVSIADRVEQRIVEVAAGHAGLIPIVAGLEVGEKVVSPVPATLRDGQRVR